MPKGPQGQKRPADTVANAIRVAKILTGEIEEDTGDSAKDKTAQALGRKGGAVRRGGRNCRQSAALRLHELPQPSDGERLLDHVHFCRTIEAEKVNMDGARDRCDFSGESD